MVDNQTESLTHVDFDPATFEVSWLFEEILKMEWCRCYKLYKGFSTHPLAGKVIKVSIMTSVFLRASLTGRVVFGVGSS